MPQPDFYAVNLGRTFPLEDNQEAARWSACFANAEVTIRPDAKFRDGQHRLRFLVGGRTTLQVASMLTLDHRETYYFAVFISEAPGLINQALLFAAETGASRYTTVKGIAISRQRANLVAGIQGGASTEAVDNDRWEGWLTFGDLDEFPQQVITLNDAVYLEPSRVRNVAEFATNTNLGGVYVYNEQRTTFAPPTGCEHTVVPDSSLAEQFVLACGPITSPTRIGGGWQIAASFQPGSGLVTFLGEPGGGDLPTPCGSSALSDSEQPRNGFDYDGAPRCPDVLRRINGAQGPDVQFRGVSGVNVGTFPDLNRVVISISGDTLIACPEYSPAEPVEYLPTNETGTPCGNLGAYPPIPGSEGYLPPSTTTQPPNQRVGDINCSGFCIWTRTGDGVDDWQLTSTACEGPCGCDSPVGEAIGGNSVSTRCFEVDVDDPDNAVRNSDFALVPPSSGWDLVGPVSIVDQHPSLAETEFPMVLMQSSTGSLSLLRQRLIRVLPHTRYDLFADFLLFSGATLTFRVTSLAGETLLSRTVNDQEYRTNQAIGFFVTEDDGVNLEVALPESIPASREALVSRLTMLRSR